MRSRPCAQPYQSFSLQRSAFLNALTTRGRQSLVLPPALIHLIMELSERDRERLADDDPTLRCLSLETGNSHEPALYCIDDRLASAIATSTHLERLSVAFLCLASAGAQRLGKAIGSSGNLRDLWITSGSVEAGQHSNRGMSLMLREAKASGSLCRLQLSYFHLKNACRPLTKFLAESHLTDLSLDQIELEDEVLLRSWTGGIAQATQLERVTVKRSSKPLVNATLRGIPHHPSLRSLKLCMEGTDLDGIDLSALEDCIASTRLQDLVVQLSVCDRWMSDEPAPAWVASIDRLLPGLSQCPSLVRVELSNFVIVEEDFPSLLAAAEGWKQLKLCDCMLGNAHAILLAERLKRPSCTLEKLDLECNVIGDPGAAALFDALSSNTTLSTLALARNRRVQSAGYEALARNLPHLSRLQSLTLPGEKTRLEPWPDSIMDALKHNTSLTDLRQITSLGVTLPPGPKILFCLLCNRFRPLLDQPMSGWPVLLAWYAGHRRRSSLKRSNDPTARQSAFYVLLRTKLDNLLDARGSENEKLADHLETLSNNSSR